MVTAAPNALASAKCSSLSEVVSSTAGPSCLAKSASRATLGSPRRRPFTGLVVVSLVVIVRVVQGGPVGRVPRRAERGQGAAQEPTLHAGRGESRGRLLGGQSGDGWLLSLVLDVRARAHDHHHLAARRLGAEAGGELGQRAPHGLLVQLGELAAHAGVP